MSRECADCFWLDDHDPDCPRVRAVQRTFLSIVPNNADDDFETICDLCESPNTWAWVITQTGTLLICQSCQEARNRDVIET